MSEQQGHRDVCMRKIATLEKQRMTRRHGKRVREAIANVQIGLMTAFTETAKTTDRKLSLARRETEAQSGIYQWHRAYFEGRLPVARLS